MPSVPRLPRSATGWLKEHIRGTANSAECTYTAASAKCFVCRTLLWKKGISMKEKKLLYLFDGAMGTYLAEQYNISVTRCEQLNLLHPEWVLAAHQAYIRAGAVSYHI